MIKLLKNNNANSILIFAVIIVASFVLFTNNSYAATAKYEFGELGELSAAIVSESEEDYAYKVKTGDRYFWNEYIENGDTIEQTLYCSKSRTGSKVKLDSFSVNDESAEAPSSYRILYNGSNLYYTVSKVSNSNGDLKTYIKNVNTSGKNKKTIKTIKNGMVILLKVYDGKLYYLLDTEDGTERKLYYLDLETKKTKYLAKGFYGINDEQNTGRYIYLLQFDSTKGIVIFDCKTDKTIRTIENGDNLALGSESIIYIKDNNGTTTLYEASLSGKNAVKKIAFPKKYKYIHHSATTAYCANTEGEDSLDIYTYNIKTDTFRQLYR